MAYRCVARKETHVEQRLQILFATAEMNPLARTGGLGDVASALPKALRTLGVDVRVVMPLYQAVRRSGVALTPVLTDLPVPLPTAVARTNVWQADLAGQGQPSAQTVPVYCIEQDAYFDRPGLYGSDQRDYPDNAERFIFFCRAILALVEHLNWFPHLLHCHDWQTALLPAYVRFLEGLAPRLTTAATVFTIHNLAYQGIFPAAMFPATGLPLTLFHAAGVEYFGHMNFMKSGLLYADYLTTVSPTYAQEICTPEFGVGLDGVLGTRRHALIGILNGVDYDVWSPERDTALAACYSATDVRGKAVCKTALLHAYGFSENPGIPLLGMISRLVDQKGVDILIAALPALLAMDLRLVILGEGASHHQEALIRQAQAYPERLGVHLGFNDTLAHQIEAGCDAILMPSRYEPCGLNQLYSMRYGTIPIARATGGLKDTVCPYQAETGEGIGFVFAEPTPEALLAAVREALSAFANRTAWHRLMHNAMAQDYSWEQSARRYVDLYQRAVDAR
jgi:starch synthase